MSSCVGSCVGFMCGHPFGIDTLPPPVSYIGLGGIITRATSNQCKQSACIISVNSFRKGVTLSLAGYRLAHEVYYSEIHFPRLAIFAFVFDSLTAFVT